MPRGYDRREAAIYLAIMLAVLAIGGAWFSELVLAYVPCKLCLWQRWPYYVGIPLLFASIVALTTAGTGAMRAVAALACLAFIISFGLGLYHAGVEWGWFAGPSDCGGRIAAGPGSVDDFRKSLEKARIVLCTEAPLRVLGLSFAGWNAVVSLLIVAFTARATASRA
jgi:disulfide bond formation protein DsbB